ncbi:MAG: ATP-binding protein [Lachnospiraceae bacterium]|nr:ATP-binding protein [Lachnospiraceae bacterium]
MIGNAFDNAIEAAQQIDDASRREISIRIGSKSGQVFLRFENFYQGETPDLKTSKADKTMHGYGIRNMEMTAEKYGGIVTCEAAEGYFILTIMIPVPAE